MVAGKSRASANGKPLGIGEDKDKAIGLALAQIERQFGKGAVMRLGESAAMDVDVISTGAISLDAALGVGGVPRGRVIELFGPEAAGKTMLALHIVSQAQKNGTAAFIDAEHALDVNFARRLGVDIDNLLVSQPDSGEEALEITDTLVRSGALDLVVIDSVAALVPKGRARRRYGRLPRRLASAADVPSPAQAHRVVAEVGDHGDLYQPVADEDRRDVRQP